MYEFVKDTKLTAIAIATENCQLSLRDSMNIFWINAAPKQNKKQAEVLKAL